MFESLVRSLSVFVFLVYLANPGLTCSKKMPQFGPVLLRAKALFGDFMRECKEAIFAVAKAVPPKAVHEATEMACRLYNSCKLSGNDTRPEVLYHCIHVELRNASHFANLPRGEKIQQAAQNYMVCGEGVAKKYSISLQSLDDVMTVAYAAIHSFGWT